MGCICLLLSLNKIKSAKTCAKSPSHQGMQAWHRANSHIYTDTPWMEFHQSWQLSHSVIESRAEQISACLVCWHPLYTDIFICCRKLKRNIRLVFLVVFTDSIRHCLCSIAKVFHYIVTLSELFLLDVFDQHGSPVCVCLCVSVCALL